MIEDSFDAQDAPNHITLDDDVVVFDSKPNKDQVLEVYENELPAGGHEGRDLDDFTLPKLPGAPPEAQGEIEINDAEVSIDEDHDGKEDPWNLQGFLKKNPDIRVWVHDHYGRIPPHDGTDVAGCERASNYVNNMIEELRRTMRNDLDGALDASLMARIFNELEKAKDNLDAHADHLSSKKKKTKNKPKKKDASADGSLVKEGQKATHVGGIIVTVPLLISRVARVCINGLVSSGHDIEATFAEQVKRFNLSDREQAETIQLLSDMGYPVRADFGDNAQNFTG